MCGCTVETLTRAASEGWLRKKEHFSTSWKQMARDTGPPTSRAKPTNERPVARSWQTQKARLAESGLPTHFFARRSLPLPRFPFLPPWPLPSGTSMARFRASGPRCPLPELLRAAFYGSMFICYSRPSLSRSPMDGVFDVPWDVRDPRQRNGNVIPIV